MMDGWIILEARRRGRQAHTGHAASEMDVDALESLPSSASTFHVRKWLATVSNPDRVDLAWPLAPLKRPHLESVAMRCWIDPQEIQTDFLFEHAYAAHCPRKRLLVHDHGLCRP